MAEDAIIFRTNDGRFFAGCLSLSTDTAYHAVAVVLRDGDFHPARDRRPRLVRRAGCTILNNNDYGFAEFT